MRGILSVSALLCMTAAAQAKPFDQMFPGHPGYEYDEVNQALRSFDYRQGRVELPGGEAVLEVPEGYYYLDPDDAGAVLTYLWDNPAGESLGMLFPADYTPWDDAAWGVTFSFEDIGYVSDEDADSYDYGALLADMQEGTRLDSRERERQGYDSVALIGWAEAPSYDKAERKLHWAMELEFGDYEDHTLNYELRALGRYGVLNANFIAGIHQLEQVKSALPDVSGMISFAEGRTYADFDPSVDTAAAVGIAGLIAGKTLASKTGLLVAGMLLLKKFWFVLLLPVFWLKNLIRR